MGNDPHPQLLIPMGAQTWWFTHTLLSAFRERNPVAQSEEYL